MNVRGSDFMRFMIAAALCSTTSLSIFYLSGIITTIGSTLQIPFILSGFVIGSVLFPAIAYLLLRKSISRVRASFLAIPLSFILLWAYVDSTKLVTNYQMLLFSLLSVSGDLFIVSIYSHGRSTSLPGAVSVGLGGLFVMTIMLIVYAALFDSNMPLIILGWDMFTALLLVAAALTGALRPGGGGKPVQGEQRG